MKKDGEGRAKGVVRLFFLGTRLALLGVALLLAGSCAMTMKAYTGPPLPADETALIKTGFDAYMVRCDDSRVDPSYLNVMVLPGKHTVELSFRRQWFGDRFLHSDVTGLVTFVAEAGHTYSVNANLLVTKEWAGLVAYQFDWQGYVKDQGTGQTLATTPGGLPVRADWIYHGSLYQNPM